MATIATIPQRESRLIASLWHTLLILALLCFISAAGHRWLTPVLKGRPNARVMTYTLTIAVEWFIFFLIWLGIRNRGTRMVDLIGGSWPTVKAILRDLGIAIAFLAVCFVVLGLISHLLKSQPPEAVRRILPRTGAECAVWLLLSLTAGICEEVIFRGYLQRQFAALTKSVALGILLQGIVFGAAHGYQGWKLMLVITVFGSLFGLLANWVRNLRPGIMAHFLQDSVNGIVAGRFVK